MKIKKKAAIAAAVFSAAMNFSACAYGPPPGEEEYDEPGAETGNNEYVSQTESSFDLSDENFYDPADNLNDCVYGPPDDEWEYKEDTLQNE